MVVIELVLAAGWLLHLGGWTLALRRAGRSAAGAGEWARELVLRLLMLLLILAALALPAGAVVRAGPVARVLLLSVFWLGQLLAVGARTWLGKAWGIGVQPRDAEVHAGPYAVVRHPIYLGTGLAILAQLALLQNLPALVLAVGALVLVPLKMHVERGLLRNGQS